MANQITVNGLETSTQQDLITQITDSMKLIYGDDINVEQSTPDGQWLMIFVQFYIDYLDLLTQVYTSMDPDQAFGKTLDQRVAYNGIQRQAGTYTITPVSLTTTQSVSLPGLDQDAVPPYTVSDNQGNKWNLIESVNILVPGTDSFNFRSAVPGRVLTTPNTITNPVTIILGVTTINNPDGYLVLGINEETDAQLRVRRVKSVSFASQGYLSALLAALENISGVTSSFVYENNSATTDMDGTPSHTIWVIVAGGSAQAIATAIYQKRNAGCGMRGAQTYTIIQKDGSPFIVKWDDVESETLYIQFDATSLDGINPPNTDAILAQLPVLFVPGVFEKVNINDLATIVQQIDPNTLVTNAGFSLSAMGSYTATLVPSTKAKQFTVAADNIDITVV